MTEVFLNILKLNTNEESKEQKTNTRKTFNERVEVSSLSNYEVSFCEKSPNDEVVPMIFQFIFHQNTNAEEAD